MAKKMKTKYKFRDYEKYLKVYGLKNFVLLKIREIRSELKAKCGTYQLLELNNLEYDLKNRDYE